MARHFCPSEAGQHQHTRDGGYELSVACPDDKPGSYPSSFTKIDTSNRLFSLLSTGRQDTQQWALGRLGGGLTPVIINESDVYASALRRAEFLAREGHRLLKPATSNHETSFFTAIQILWIQSELPPNKRIKPWQDGHYAAIATTHPEAIWHASGDPNYYRHLSRVATNQAVGGVSFGVTPLFRENILTVETPALAGGGIMPDILEAPQSYGPWSAEQVTNLRIKLAEQDGTMNQPQITGAFRILFDTTHCQ